MERTDYTKEIVPGKTVILSGWVTSIRDLGNLKFVVLRDREGEVQITGKKELTSKKVMKTMDSLNEEDVISVKGKVVKNKNAPGGKEVLPLKIEIINKVKSPLPIAMTKKIKSGLDKRLEYRPLDLRKLENVAIFKIQAKITETMEEYLREKGFLQVFTPCIMGAASEGGADVFPVNYFDKAAFLRQDPQLHRELLIIAGFDKIFDLGPSWRAEPSHTPRHLCEHRGCAVELAFIKDESDVMKVEEELIVYTLKKVKKECKEELELLGKKVKIPKTPFPELRFPKIYEILKKLGKKIPFGEDYDRKSEVLLAEYVKKKYKSDFFFVNRFPSKTKPFYVMKVDEEPRWARSVDLIFKGLEQSSGGQREHRYKKIVQQIKEKGMNVEGMKWFTEFFKYGVPPMGGFCLGIERFTMQLLDLKNIREAVLFPRTPERLLP
jgi:aspartyl-tRNA synthetase